MGVGVGYDPRLGVPGLVGVEGQPVLPRDALRGPLQLPGVGVLEPVPRVEVGVVDDDVGVRDPALVVVVVDDGHLVVAEVLPHS